MLTRQSAALHPRLPSTSTKTTANPNFQRHFALYQTALTTKPLARLQHNRQVSSPTKLHGGHQQPAHRLIGHPPHPPLSPPEHRTSVRILRSHLPHIPSQRVHIDPLTRHRRLPPAESGLHLHPAFGRLVALRLHRGSRFTARGRLQGLEVAVCGDVAVGCGILPLLCASGGRVE